MTKKYRRLTLPKNDREVKCENRKLFHLKSSDNTNFKKVPFENQEGIFVFEKNRSNLSQTLPLVFSAGLKTFGLAQDSNPDIPVEWEMLK